MKLELYKWGIELQYGDGRLVALNVHPGFFQLGWWQMWYDGPHKAIHLGWFNFYWNWGEIAEEDK